MTAFWPRGMLVTVAVLAASIAYADGPAPLKETTVGMTGRLDDVVLPGSELEAKPIADRKVPVVLRVVRATPDGLAFRYDLEYYGLDPGTFDLCDSLRRKDGSAATGLPPLPVTVVPIRPPGVTMPNELEIRRGPRLGGYWLLVGGVVVVWGVGFVALVAWFFVPLFRRGRSAGPVATPVSLADRLRPLVEGAVAGKLTQAELAGLERGLFAFWRKRLGLEAADPAEAFATLRTHPDAGPLLAALEDWLHRPAPPAAVDVPALLKPYRDLPPDAAEFVAVRDGAEKS